MEKFLDINRLKEVTPIEQRQPLSQEVEKFNTYYIKWALYPLIEIYMNNSCQDILNRIRTNSLQNNNLQLGGDDNQNVILKS